MNRMRPSYVVAIPALVHLSLVAWLGVDVPIWDDFTAVLQRIQKFETHGLRLYDVLLPHNEHLYVVPGLLIVACYELFDRCDFKLLMAIGWAGWSLGSVTLGWVHRRFQMPLWGVFIAACHLHGLAQHDAFFWGMAAVQLGVLMGSSVAAAAGLAYLESTPLLLLACSFGAVAAFSSSHGIVTALIGGVLLIARGYRKLALAPLVCGAAAAAVLVLYRSFGHVDTPHVGLEPILILRFAFRVLGSSLPMQGGSVAEAFGCSLIIGIAGTAVVLARMRDREQHLASGASFTAALGAISVGWAFLIAIGRVGFGLEYAVASRYAVVGQLALVALTLQCALVWQAARRVGRVGIAYSSVAIVAATLAAMMWSDTQALDTTWQTHEFRKRAYGWVSRTPRIRKRELEALVWDPQFGREMLEYACSRKLLRACRPRDREAP